MSDGTRDGRKGGSGYTMKRYWASGKRWIAGVKVKGTADEVAEE